jgi:DNA modification methylase
VAEPRIIIDHGDCLAVMAGLPDASVDAIVTDPPYGLGFMGKAWDDLPPGLPWAQECLRVLKPGGHLLAFGGTRTWHRLAVAVEDAGFEMRDSIAWLYGSGFPKSQDVAKAIDKANGRKFEDRYALGRHIRERREALGLTRAEVNGWLGAATKAEHYESDSPGFARVPTLADWQILRERLGLSDEHAAVVERTEAERDVIGTRKAPGGEWTAEGRRRGGIGGYDIPVTAPATPAAQQWQGWGTALKPAFEPIVVARKPLAGTVAANVQQHGTGALNIDGCRVQSLDAPEGRLRHGGRAQKSDSMAGGPLRDVRPASPAGRWPTNVVLDGDAAEALDADVGTLTSGSRKAGDHGLMGYMGADVAPMPEVVGDSGGASRFFPVFRYQAKAPTRERPRYTDTNGVKHAHATVKPLELMRWLVRLVTPPGGLVLDPFAGSGTTVEACILEGFGCHGIEREAEHLPMIEIRLARQGYLDAATVDEDETDDDGEAA